MADELFNKDLRFKNMPWAQYNIRQPVQSVQGVPPVKASVDRGFEFLVGPEGAPDWPAEYISETTTDRVDTPEGSFPMTVSARRFDLSNPPVAFLYDSASDTMVPQDVPPLESWFDKNSYDQPTHQGAYLANLMNDKLSIRPTEDYFGGSKEELDRIFGPKVTNASWANGDEFNTAMARPGQPPSRRQLNPVELLKQKEALERMVEQLTGQMKLQEQTMKAMQEYQSNPGNDEETRRANYIRLLRDTKSLHQPPKKPGEP